MTDQQELDRVCAEVALGDPEAMDFMATWMTYCHAIDDIVDTMEDGRPTMAPELIVGTFAMAALLYNHPFYMKHQKHLFPVALMVTNAYADVVNWERHPKPHLRAIADVIRCNGNEMYFAVAMIKGGYNHMRKCSSIIREKSWILQHKEE